MSERGPQIMLRGHGPVALQVIVAGPDIAARLRLAFDGLEDAPRIVERPDYPRNLWHAMGSATYEHYFVAGVPP